MIFTSFFSPSPTSVNIRYASRRLLALRQTFLSRPVSSPLAQRQHKAWTHAQSHPLTPQVDAAELMVKDHSLQAHDAPRLGRPRRINTFDPSKLGSNNHIVISPTTPYIYISTSPRNPKGRILNRRLIRMYLPHFQGEHKLNGVSGFFYYFRPPNSPPLAGGIRFRVTPSSDPATFASGTDLLADTGLPWSCTLITSAGTVRSRIIPNLLLRDGLVSQEALDSALRWGQQIKRGELRHQTRLVYAFGQPFVMSMKDRNAALFILGKDSGVHFGMVYVTSFWVGRGGREGRRFTPYAGYALCCFERSTLPEHAGKRVVVLRVLRSLDSDPVRRVLPLDADKRIAELEPREGELLKQSRRRKVAPWSVDVDSHPGSVKTVEKALKILFENEELYGPYVPDDGL